MTARIAALFAMILMVSFAQAQPPSSPDSVYHLNVRLTNQSAVVHGLDVHRGNPVLVTMFYGSCPMTCPLLIDTLRAVERNLTPQQRIDLRVLMISIDPEHDTPKALLALAQQRHLDSDRWTLARADEKDVRKIAALLNVQYRALPNGGYNHSSIVTLLDPDGTIVMQSATLGRADPELLAALRKAAEKHPIVASP